MVEHVEEIVGAIYLYADQEKPKKKNKSSFLDYVKSKFEDHEKHFEDKRQALVAKNGNYRVQYMGLHGQKCKFLFDLYIGLIDLKWRYALSLLFNAFLISFLTFSILWWLMCYNHGDFQEHNKVNPNWTACVSDMQNYETSLLFAIETQTTIGYGFAYPNIDCSGSIVLVFLQATIQRFLESILLGFIFAKFAKPSRRRKTLMFSKHACISRQNGGLVLEIRIADMRKSRLLDAKIRGVLVKRYLADENCMYPLYLNDVKFQVDAMKDKLVLMWPVIVTHTITEKSPFWVIKSSDMCNEKFELIVFLDGKLETTGEYCQARTSYTQKEILWGHRFDKTNHFDTKNGVLEVDFAGFNDVIYYESIYYSAKELATLNSRSSPFQHTSGTEKGVERSTLNSTSSRFQHASGTGQGEERSNVIRTNNTSNSIRVQYTDDNRSHDNCIVSETKPRPSRQCLRKKRLVASFSKQTTSAPRENQLSNRLSVISTDYHTAEEDFSPEEEGDCSNSTLESTFEKQYISSDVYDSKL